MGKTRAVTGGSVARPAFLCPVCFTNGPIVEPGPEQYSETWRLFDEHLAAHTKWELEAYVWRIMRTGTHHATSPLPGTGVHSGS